MITEDTDLKLRVFVYDFAANHPVEAARVATTLAGTLQEKFTDIFGRATLKVPGGPCTLEVSAPGYAGTTGTVNVNDDPEDVAVPLTRAVRPQDITCALSVRIADVVTSLPLRHAIANITPVPGRTGTTLAAKADATGWAHLYPVEFNSEYEVRASAAGYGIAPALIWRPRQDRAHAEFLLEPNPTTLAIRVEGPEPGGSGAVKPIGDAQVTLTGFDFVDDDDSAPLFGPVFGRTGPRPIPNIPQAAYDDMVLKWGRLDFAGLPPARYRVTVVRPDYVPLTLVVDVVPELGYGGLLGARHPTLISGGTSDVPATLKSAFTECPITLDMPDHDPAAVVHAEVLVGGMLGWASEGFGATTPVTTNGRFPFGVAITKDLLAGPYEVWAKAFFDWTAGGLATAPHEDIRQELGLTTDHIVVQVPPAYDGAGPSLAKLEIRHPKARLVGELRWALGLEGHDQNPSATSRQRSQVWGVDGGTNEIFLELKELNGELSQSLRTHQIPVKQDGHFEAMLPIGHYQVAIVRKPGATTEEHLLPSTGMMLEHFFEEMRPQAGGGLIASTTEPWPGPINLGIVRGRASVILAVGRMTGVRSVRLTALCEWTQLWGRAKIADRVYVSSRNGRTPLEPRGLLAATLTGSSVYGHAVNRKDLVRDDSGFTFEKVPDGSYQVGATSLLPDLLEDVGGTPLVVSWKNDPTQPSWSDKPSVIQDLKAKVRVGGTITIDRMDQVLTGSPPRVRLVWMRGSQPTRILFHFPGTAPPSSNEAPLESDVWRYQGLYQWTIPPPPPQPPPAAGTPPGPPAKRKAWIYFADKDDWKEINVAPGDTVTVRYPFRIAPTVVRGGGPIRRPIAFEVDLVDADTGVLLGDGEVKVTFGAWTGQVNIHAGSGRVDAPLEFDIKDPQTDIVVPPHGYSKQHAQDLRNWHTPQGKAPVRRMRLLVQKSYGDVFFRVKDPSGTVVQGIAVHCLLNAGGVPMAESHVTNSSGETSPSPMPKGEHRITIDKRGYRLVDFILKIPDQLPAATPTASGAPPPIPWPIDLQALPKPTIAAINIDLDGIVLEGVADPPRTTLGWSISATAAAGINDPIARTALLNLSDPGIAAARAMGGSFTFWDSIVAGAGAWKDDEAAGITVTARGEIEVASLKRGVVKWGAVVITERGAVTIKDAPSTSELEVVYPSAFLRGMLNLWRRLFSLNSRWSSAETFFRNRGLDSDAIETISSHEIKLNTRAFKWKPPFWPKKATFAVRRPGNGGGLGYIANGEVAGALADWLPGKVFPALGWKALAGSWGLAFDFDFNASVDPRSFNLTAGYTYTKPEEADGPIWFHEWLKPHRSTESRTFGTVTGSVGARGDLLPGVQELEKASWQAKIALGVEVGEFKVEWRIPLAAHLVRVTPMFPWLGLASGVFYVTNVSLVLGLRLEGKADIEFSYLLNKGSGVTANRAAPVMTSGAPTAAPDNPALKHQIGFRAAILGFAGIQAGYDAVAYGRVEIQFGVQVRHEDLKITEAAPTVKAYDLALILGGRVELRVVIFTYTGNFHTTYRMHAIVDPPPATQLIEHETTWSATTPLTGWTHEAPSKGPLLRTVGPPPRLAPGLILVGETDAKILSCRVRELRASRPSLGAALPEIQGAMMLAGATLDPSTSAALVAVTEDLRPKGWAPVMDLITTRLENGAFQPPRRIRRPRGVVVDMAVANSQSGPIAFWLHGPRGWEGPEEEVELYFCPLDSANTSIPIPLDGGCLSMVRAVGTCHSAALVAAALAEAAPPRLWWVQADGTVSPDSFGENLLAPFDVPISALAVAADPEGHRHLVAWTTDRGTTVTIGAAELAEIEPSPAQDISAGQSVTAAWKPLIVRNLEKPGPSARLALCVALEKGWFLGWVEEKEGAFMIRALRLADGHVVDLSSPKIEGAYRDALIVGIEGEAVLVRVVTSSGSKSQVLDVPVRPVGAKAAGIGDAAS